MSRGKDLEKKIKELLKEVFIQKCHVDGASMTKDEEESIFLLDGADAIENLRDIFDELIRFKKECVDGDKAELMQKSEQFEGMLQKLEAEVRSHISVEHQLKLHIENNQLHSEELEGLNQKYLAQVKELSEKLKGHGRAGFERKESKETMEKIGKLEGLIAKKDLLIRSLEAEVAKFKKQGEKENKAARHGEAIQEIKQKFEEKSADLLKIEQIIREKATPKPMKERNRSTKKSINDSEISKVRATDIRNKAFSRSHSRSTSDQVRPLSGLRKRA